MPFYLEIVIAFFWFLKVGQRLLFGEPSPLVASIRHDRVTRGTFFPNAVLVTVAVADRS